MKFIDMFCGIGTIRMGIEQAGHECVYSVEWDKWKRKIYSIIFGGEPDAGDIKGLRGEQLPTADIWCFGAPCQDFSIAGKREGLEGDRSSLVREVFRLVREIKEEYRPKYLIYENVKGMLSSNKGFDFLEILVEMESLGYDTIEYSLLNSKDFGVPQNRERVFTIGHFRRRSTRKIFPITRADAENINTVKTINTKDSKGKEPPQQDRIYRTDGLMTALSSQLGGRYNIEVSACLTPGRVEKIQNGRRFKKPGEPMFTLTTQDIHGVLIKEAAILRPVRTEYGKAIRKQYENGEIQESRHNMTKLEPRTDGISNTITTVQKDNLLYIKEATKQGYVEATTGDSINLAFPDSKTRRGRVGKGVAQTLDCSCNQGTLQGGRIRRLTPKECWRLQGIKDEITNKVVAAGISDSQMYRAAGDACTVNVIYEIAKRMI